MTPASYAVRSFGRELRSGEVLVAYGQNGEPLRPHQGFPLRIVVPGSGGFSNVKWVHRLKVVDKPYLTPSERFQGKYAPKSVITSPSGGQHLPGRGFYTITGLAWSGQGAIKSVEVSADGGRNWDCTGGTVVAHHRAGKN